MNRKTLSFSEIEKLKRECVLLWWKKEGYFAGQIRDFPEVQAQAETMDQLELTLHKLFNDAYGTTLPSFTNKIDVDEIELSNRKANFIGIIFASIFALFIIFSFGLIIFSQTEQELCIDDNCKPTTFINSVLVRLQGETFWRNQKKVCLKKIEEKKLLAKLKIDPHGFMEDLLKDKLDKEKKAEMDNRYAEIMRTLNDGRKNLLKNMDETERALFLAKEKVNDNLSKELEIANQKQIQIDLLQTIHKYEKLIAKIEVKIHE